MKPWHLAFVFTSGLVCAFAIVGIARVANTVSAHRLIVPEAEPIRPDHDWRQVQRAHAMRIPEGPAPDIEVRVGGSIELGPTHRVRQESDDERELAFRTMRLDSGPGTVGVQAWQGDGFCGTTARLRFGPSPTDVLVRVEEFRDFGPPFESVWSHLHGTIRFDSWPIEPGVTRVAFELEGRQGGQSRTFQAAFVVPR